MNCIWASLNGSCGKENTFTNFSLLPSTVLSLGSLFQWWYYLFVRQTSLWLVGWLASVLKPYWKMCIFISMSSHFISFQNTISVAISSKDRSISSFYCHNAHIDFKYPMQFILSLSDFKKEKRLNLIPRLLYSTSYTIQRIFLLGS